MITKEGWEEEFDRCFTGMYFNAYLEPIRDFIRRLLLEARREGANSAAKYVKENMWRTDVLQAPPEHRLTLQELYEAARTAGENDDERGVKK